MSQSLSIAAVLVVRLWAALGKADEIAACIFGYVNSATDRKWHSYWAGVLNELRFSIGEFRKQFSEPNLAQTLEFCEFAKQSDVEPLLATAVEALEQTIRRIQDERSRPKNPPQTSAVDGPTNTKIVKQYGPWKVVKSLSEGGQAHTFLVHRNSEKTLFVLKRLKNPDRIDRFRQEIEASLSLSHRNIVKVIDHNLEREPYYFVAEYCEKGPIRDYAELRGMSVVEKLEIFLQICAGIAFAHIHGIIHRDIKPENIFLRGDGTPVLGDFGICFTGEKGERLTLIDEAVGPRNYLAPELEDGRANEVRWHSDVYSAGKLLYWIISGREFAREKHRTDEFDLARKDAIPEHFLINELLDQMIVADPAKRFKDGNQLAYAVEALISRIHAGGHIMDVSTPQKCLYCANGEYRIVVEPILAEIRQATDNAFSFAGIRGIGNPLWGVFVCEHCGNVQLFRPDRSRDPNVWKKS